MTAMNSIQDREWRRMKRKLTAAEGSDDPLQQLRVCREAESVFNAVGWPDWWARVERLKFDAKAEVERWW